MSRNNSHGESLTPILTTVGTVLPDAQQGTNAKTQPIGLVTASDIGRKGGSSRTLAKRLAAKENGKLGGRPKKTANPPGATVGEVNYAEIAINKKAWNTFTPTQMCDY
jgi:hypothetical protein